MTLPLSTFEGRKSWSAVCEGAGKHPNEDLVTVHEHGDTTDVLVMDGATSVAERNYCDTAAGDVAWFVRTFAAELTATFAQNTSQDARVLNATLATYAAWRASTREIAVPPCAWPIAALTWIRIVHRGHLDELHLYCLGDCKTLLRDTAGVVRDLDPWTNPQDGVLQRAIGEMLAEGVTDRAVRLERLMPLLRHRRKEQNEHPTPSVLCMRPAGPFAARKAVLQLEAGSMLLAMTDGFYRLVDPYGLYSSASLAEACGSRGLKGMLSELRAAEAENDGGDLAVKAADDASAVMWISGVTQFCP